MNGFSRRFTEGEGAGDRPRVQVDGPRPTWRTRSANFPDVPANSSSLPDGALVVGTDLGVLYRRRARPLERGWAPNLPVTVAMDVELGPDGKIYAATHGRGIWSIRLLPLASTR